jgi:hypothetical protein
MPNENNEELFLRQNSIKNKKLNTAHLNIKKN